MPLPSPREFHLRNFLKFQDQIISRVTRYEGSVTSKAFITDGTRTEVRVNRRSRVTQHYSDISNRHERRLTISKHGLGLALTRKIQPLRRCAQDEIIYLLTIARLCPMHMRLPLPHVQNHVSFSSTSAGSPSQRSGCHSSGSG